MDESISYKFFRTTKAGKGKKSHSHLVYVNETKGSGVVSTENEHTHEVQPWETYNYLMPKTEMESPETTGKNPPIYILMPAEEDGHFHKLEKEIQETKEPRGEDEDIVSDVRNLFKEALENESDYRKRGEESEDFISGFGQWEKKIKDDLKNQDRAALTINEIEPKIDILSGHQRQNRLDIKYFPVEEGDSITAEILNALSKNVLEQNNFDYEETEAFEDAMITGRGNFNIRVDYDKNIEGDIVIEWFPWQQTFYGPHNKKDLADLEYLFKAQWHSKAFIKNMWPDKADDIQTDFDDVFKDSHRTLKTDQYENPEAQPSEVSTDYDKSRPEFVDIAKKKFRVLECWRKEYNTVQILTNVVDGVYHNTEFWSKKDIASAKTLSGFNSVEVKRHRMRISTIANRVFLDDKYPDLPVQDFHLIPIYAKKRGKRIWGKIEAVKDAQREINKRHSQGVDILNKMAAYGWFIDSQTFPTPKEEKNFEENASTPAFVQKVTDVRNIPVKVEGVRFPTELANYEKLASDKVKEIMNINIEMLGMPSGAGSGIQEVGRRRQGLIGNEFLFDNLSLGKRKLGRLVAAYIQDVYTVDRMIRILENRAGRGEVIEPQNIPTGSEMAGILSQTKEAAGPKYDPAILKMILENMDLTKYDVVVGESAFSPTNRQANFIIWLEASKSGVPVPPTLLVDLSDLPDKDRVKKEIEAMALAQQQEAEKTRQVELIKSGINPMTMTKESVQGGE